MDPKSDQSGWPSILQILGICLTFHLKVQQGPLPHLFLEAELKRVTGDTSLLEVYPSPWICFIIIATLMHAFLIVGERGSKMPMFCSST